MEGKRQVGRQGGEGGAGAAWREGGAPGSDSLDSVGTAELNPVCNNDEQDLIIK